MLAGIRQSASDWAGVRRLGLLSLGFIQKFNATGRQGDISAARFRHYRSDRASDYRPDSRSSTRRRLSRRWRVSYTAHTTSLRTSARAPRASRPSYAATANRIAEIWGVEGYRDRSGMLHGLSPNEAAPLRVEVSRSAPRENRSIPHVSGPRSTVLTRHARTAATKLVPTRLHPSAYANCGACRASALGRRREIRTARK